MATIYGTSANDQLVGTTKADSIFGGLGTDTLDGGTGNDTIDAGAGADSVLGGSGDDLLYGGQGTPVGSTLINNGTFDSNTNGWTGTDIEWNPESAYFSNGSNNGVIEMDGTTGPTTVVQQSFVVDGAVSASVTLRSIIRTAGTVGTDGFRLEVLDAKGAVVGSQIILPGSRTAWTNYTLNVSLPAAGVYTLRMTEVGNNDSLGAVVDNVQVTTTSVIADVANDTLAGGAGNDTLYGYNGNDQLNGDGNDDLVYGGNGDDSLNGGTEVDTLYGDGGNDSLYGGSGADRVFGGENADLIFGGTENDTLAGDAGDDTLNGDAGNDSVSGGDDQDLFLIGASEGFDTILGGEGGTDRDTLSFAGSTAGVTVTLSGSETGSYVAGTGAGTFSQIEVVIGSAQADTLNAAAATAPVTLFGGAGNDTITGGLLNDSLSGDDGNDRIYGGSGNDTLLGGIGSDMLAGGAGNDILTGGGDADTFEVGVNDDTDTIDGGNTGTDLDRLDFTGTGSGVNVVFSGNESGFYTYGGGSGTFAEIEQVGSTAYDDRLNASQTMGNMNLGGGEGNDAITTGSGNDQLFGGSGNDTLTAGTGADVLTGDEGTDDLYGGDGNDVLYGGGGDDSILSGGDGNDTVYGGAGNDQFGSESGRDQMFGGDGDDRFLGGIDDTVDGGAGGNDVLDLSFWGWAGTNILYSSSDPQSGIVQFLDAGGNVQNSMSFSNIEHVLPCFTPGTRVRTARGDVPVEDLVVGDRVRTRDHGLQTLRWVGSRTLSLADLIVQPKLKPIRMDAGSLGAGLPVRTMTVSPQHRMLLQDPRAEMLFGEAEVLVAAVHLTSLKGVEQVLPAGVTYIHLLFDAHEIILADDVWTESFQPADRTLGCMDAEQRAEIEALFPDLRGDFRNFPAARMTLKGFEARVMLAA
ncbi:MAG: Hint domain-containing protein [Candidatus Saccharibacteria bacterium]|nr:Hint domain-containing protein [Pseudorhodobacter sp.]